MSKLPTFFTYDGRTWVLKELAEAHDMKPSTLRSRLYRGVPLKQALTNPVGPAMTRKGQRKQGPHPKTIKKLMGNTFGTLTVIGHETGPGWKWKCKCSCGEEVLRGTSYLLTVSREKVAATCNTRRHKNGLPLFEEMPEYTTWTGMRSRCGNPNNKRYARYGGRGIKVCPQWQWQNAESGFMQFVQDMGRKPSPDLTIERVDNDGNYEPSNCVWATKTQQARNRRSSRTLTIQGETRTIAEWAELSGRDYETIRRWAVDKNLSPERAVFGRLPTFHERMRDRAVVLTYEGRSVTVSELSEITGIAENTLRHRLSRGLSVEEVTRYEGVAKSGATLYEYQGKTWSIGQLARKAGMTPRQISKRVRLGWSIKRAVTEPIKQTKGGQDEQAR